MNSSEKKSILYTTPAWASSVLTAFLSLLIPFIVAGIAALIGGLIGIPSQELNESNDLGDLLGYLITGIAFAIMCFFICRAHPKSYWYTPIVSNGMTLWMGLGNYLNGNLQLNQLMFTLGVGWLLSIIAAIWGMKMGKRAIRDGTLR